MRIYVNLISRLPRRKTYDLTNLVSVLNFKTNLGKVSIWVMNTRRIAKGDLSTVVYRVGPGNNVNPASIPTDFAALITSVEKSAAPPLG